MNHKTLFLLTLILFLLVTDLRLSRIKYLFLLSITLQAFSFPKALFTFRSLLLRLLLFAKDSNFLILKRNLFGLRNQRVLRNQLLDFPFVLLLDQFVFLQLDLKFLLSFFLVILLPKLYASYFFIFLAFLAILMLVLLFMNVNSVTLNILLSFDNFC